MRMHVSLRVKDLEASARLYSRLLGAEPALRRHDYAKWFLDHPPVNLSIVSAGGPWGLEHLGIEAESREELETLRARAEGAGTTLVDEGETTCCYARSDKIWLTDPAGVRWELFYTLGQVGDAPSAAGRPARDGEPGCCEPAVRAEPPGRVGKPCCEPGCCEAGDGDPAGIFGPPAARRASTEPACCEPGCCQEAGT